MAGEISLNIAALEGFNKFLYVDVASYIDSEVTVDSGHPV